MTRQDILAAARELSDEEFRQLRLDLIDMVRERQAKPYVEKAETEIVTGLQETGAIPKPEAATEIVPDQDVTSYPAWVNPGTDHAKMYHYGDIVLHDGKLVRSTHQGLNHWEPGTLDYDGRIWEDITPVEPEPDPETPPAEEIPAEPEAPEFVQPTGGHDAYGVGDRVTYNGSVYESTIAANVWAPDGHPAGWKLIS